jgi:hypothetical protein
MGNVTAQAALVERTGAGASFALTYEGEEAAAITILVDTATDLALGEPVALNVSMLGVVLPQPDAGEAAGSPRAGDVDELPVIQP